MESLIIYFIAGMAQEFLYTLSIRFISKEKAIASAITVFFASLVVLIVFYNIVMFLDPKESIISIIVYAAGVATGVFLAVKLKVEKKTQLKI